MYFTKEDESGIPGARDRPEAKGGAQICASPDVIEVTPAMIKAGLEELMNGFPGSASDHDAPIVESIFKAMYAARYSQASEPQGPVLDLEQHWRAGEQHSP